MIQSTELHPNTRFKLGLKDLKLVSQIRETSKFCVRLGVFQDQSWEPLSFLASFLCYCSSVHLNHYTIHSLSFSGIFDPGDHKVFVFPMGINSSSPDVAANLQMWDMTQHSQILKFATQQEPVISHQTSLWKRQVKPDKICDSPAAVWLPVNQTISSFGLQWIFVLDSPIFCPEDRHLNVKIRAFDIRNARNK